MNMTREQLEAELRRQPADVRDYLANMLIETLDASEDEDVNEAESHRRWLAYTPGEMEAMSEEESIADLEDQLRQCS